MVGEVVVMVAVAATVGPPAPQGQRVPPALEPLVPGTVAAAPGMARAVALVKATALAAPVIAQVMRRLPQLRQRQRLPLLV